jgi:hypothetical protein
MTGDSPRAAWAERLETGLVDMDAADLEREIASEVGQIQEHVLSARCLSILRDIVRFQGVQTVADVWGASEAST